MIDINCSYISKQQKLFMLLSKLALVSVLKEQSRDFGYRRALPEVLFEMLILHDLQPSFKARPFHC